MSQTPDEQEPIPLPPGFAAKVSRRDMIRTAVIGGAVVMVSGCVDRETPLEPEDPSQPGGGVVAEGGDAGSSYMGEILITSFNFPPKGWALCNGQFLPINQNQALFSLLGTMYGGNGQTTFALPNLRGRVPIHMGNGHTVGEAAGSTAVTVNIQQLPTHTHQMQGSSNSANTTADPTGTLIGPANGLYSMSLRRLVDPREKHIPEDAVRIQVPTFANDTNPNTTLSPQMVTSVGGSQPHTNMQPYAVVSCCINLQGIFPSQN